MVCSLGSGRMAVMVRLLEAGSFTQNITEEAGHKKLVPQYISKEMREADEANLLDEEDMHVFGFEPMADPLHLVCCSACKKPVKASQYVAHAGLCRSLRTMEETNLELETGVGYRKPQKKERRKPLTVYANRAPVVDRERSEILDGDDGNGSESLMDGQIGIASSFPIDPKRNCTSVDTAYLMDASGVSPDNTGHSASIVPLSTKRSKLIASGCMPPLDDASGVTRIVNTHDRYASRDFPGGRILESEMPNMYRGKVHNSCLQAKDAPVPLTTKIYYSQRNSRLRTALRHQFHNASNKEFCCDGVSPETSQKSRMLLQASSQRVCSLQQVDDQLIKKQEPSVLKPDQIHAQSSDSSKSGGCLPSSNFSNQFSVDNVARAHAASAGSTKGRYRSKPYSFAGSSGKLLGTMQKPNGSVPVV